MGASLGLLVAMALATTTTDRSSADDYHCRLLGDDGELIELNLSLAGNLSASISDSTTSKWPTSFALKRSNRFGGQFGSNLWEIVPSPAIPTDIIEHISFDTIFEMENVALVVRDNRLPNQNITSPLARGTCEGMTSFHEAAQ